MVYFAFFLAFAETCIVSAREEAFLTCTYNLHALARKKKNIVLLFTCENCLFSQPITSFCTS